jgi:high affinity Mn2+ porin
MRSILLIVLLGLPFITQAQNPSVKDTTDHRLNLHFQLTTVTQRKFSMQAPYTGNNSLIKKTEKASTMTSTLFMGCRLWRNAAGYLNPEIAGGSGISSAHGIADFTNGEAFRVGDPAPTIYAARVYIRQYINLSDEKEELAEGANQILKSRAKKYISVTAGKFSIADFFDNNAYSHDPRAQFFNWGLMSNGAWDYPANVRGYTWGGVLEYGSPHFKIRAASVMVPREANGNIMDKNYSKANSNVVEFELPYKTANLHGIIRLLAFYTKAHMGNYDLSVQDNPTAPDITATRKYSRTKWGLGVNIEQPLNENAGLFARASWNDGKNETWAFTEIDRSASVGVLSNAKFLHRPTDQIGLGTVLSGLSPMHQRYLAAGGYGFIIGDGHLNYGYEWVTELFYRLNILHEGFYLTPNYQFVVNPGYNKDRGPAHIIALRVHIEI